MHLLILGGSGRTGQQIIDLALSRGHSLTALVREPTSVTPREGLTIATGTPLEQADIEAAINATRSPPDAIIVALASVRTSGSPFAAPISPPHLMADSHTNVISAMEKFGIKRIVTISAYGVGDSNAEVFLPMRLLLNHTNMKVSFDDHNELESLVRKSGLDWTLVRPVMMAEGEQKPVKVYGERGMGAGMMPSVTRRSVAAFIVEEVLEKGNWTTKTPVIAN